MGFCLFANVAVAARHALDSLGAERVLVLDWDVHHGNGTNAIFHDSREVLFVSIHQFPFWPGTGPLDDVGEGEGEGYSINLPVPAGTGEAAFLSLIEHIVMPVARQYRPDLILISAGYDAHRDDPLGGLALDTASFASMSNRMRALGRGARRARRRGARGRLRPATRWRTRSRRRWRRWTAGRGSPRSRATRWRTTPPRCSAATGTSERAAGRRRGSARRAARPAAAAPSGVVNWPE